MRQEIHPSGEDSETAVTFKQSCDKKDSLLIFRVNDRYENPDKPSFVSKISEDKMKTALNMDRNGEHFLKEEYCFFNGKFKRCRDFLTLTASVYHPLLKRQMPLAVLKLNKRTQKTLRCFGLFLMRVYEKSQVTTTRYLILWAGAPKWPELT